MLRSRCLAIVTLILSSSAACGSSRAASTGRTGSSRADAGAPSGALDQSASVEHKADGNDNPSGVPLQPVSSPSAPQQPSANTPIVQPNSMRGAVLIDQSGPGNPAGVSDADAQRLVAGGPIGNAQWLYPYEGTIFPRGMLAPTLMWNGDPADAAYVHIQSKLFEYKGLLKPDAAPGGAALTVPQDVWDKAGQQTSGVDDTYTLEVSTLAGGKVSGPLTTHFKIAQATLKGSIYYNTYASALPGAAIGGNVLRIPPGGKAELFLSTTCNGCHSVSADGSRIISQVGLATGGSSFPIAPGGAANPMASVGGPRTSFGALYPDGSKYLATSVVIEVARSFLTQGLGGPMDATLYDSSTGEVVPNTGIPAGALMPNFSPDGNHLVFNDYAINEAHGLAVMDYAVASNTASNYKMLTHETDPVRPAWPFFLPDNRGVIYIETDSVDFSGGGAGLAGQVGAAPASDLYIADLATGKVSMLAQAMGFGSEADAASGKSYLPLPADELHHHYFPTVSPVAAGGYFWVFFDTVRHYGNQGLARALWGTAVDISPNGSYVADPSHPAFFLPGQEFGTGNHRAFAALDPCKKDGDSCTSGIDCCGGVCSFPDTQEEFVERTGTCAPPKMNMCAKRDEKCRTTADCCAPEMGQPANECIAGFCAYIPLN